MRRRKMIATWVLGSLAVGFTVATMLGMLEAHEHVGDSIAAALVPLVVLAGALALVWWDA
jgi:hypothetical protein